MTVLSAMTLRVIRPVEPFEERTVVNGMSYGVSYCGYDVRIADDITISPGEFKLAATLEKFNTPVDTVAFVHDKSTWARRGLALQNTVIEPGWRGYLTLEITNHGAETIRVCSGDPIAQIVYHRLDTAVRGYSGKYQDQGPEPIPARYE